MAYKEIIYNVRDNVATIFMNRPERGNSISTVMGTELKLAIDEAINDTNVRIIIFTGSGKYFCTGMDLGAGMQGDMEQRLKDGTAANYGLELFEKFKNCKKPIIARINGPALGGALGLIFCCPIRIAAINNVYFCFAEVKRGIVPALISAYIVKQLGTFQSKQFMITGMRFSSERAYQLGVLSSIVQTDQLDIEVDRYVKELLSSAPRAMGVIMETVEYVAEHTHDKNVDKVKQIFAQTVHSEEALYGISCFVQKQKPDWASLIAKL